MSKGELWKGVMISAIIGGAFAVIGYHAIYFALEMVGTFGEGLGVDDRSRAIYSAAHKVVHLFAAACGLAIGWFHYKRNWTLFTIAIIAILAGGSYGVLNMYGFTSANRVTVAAVKDASRTAAERSYQAARADLMGQIDWLQKTATTEEGAERRRLLKEVDAKRKELSEIKPPVPTAETVISDPQSNTLARLFATSAERWMIGLPFFLAVLLFLAESFSFIVVGHMAAAIVAMFAGYSSASDRKLPSSSEPSGGKDKSEPATVAKQDEKVVAFPAAVKAEPAQLQAAPQALPAPIPKVSAAPRVPAPAPKQIVSLSLQPKQYSTVEEYLADHPSVSRQRDIADALKVSEAKVSRDIKRLKGRGKVKADRNGRANAITHTPRRTGGLYAVGH